MLSLQLQCSCSCEAPVWGAPSKTATLKGNAPQADYIYVGDSAIPDAATTSAVASDQANWSPLADSASSISYYYYNVTTSTFFYYDGDSNNVTNTNSNSVQGSYNYYNYQTNTINYYNSTSNVSYTITDFNSITNNVIGSYNGNNNTGSSPCCRLS